MSNKKRTRKGSTQQEDQEASDENTTDKTSVPSKQTSGTRHTSTKRQRTIVNTSDDATEAVVNSAADVISGSPPVEASQPRSHAYGTRAANRLRRPGQDVGLNWQEARKEKEAAEATRAEKKAHDELKKRNAVVQSRLEEEGVRRLAALERGREQEDEEEDEHLGLTGIARGYLAASSKAGAAQQPGPDERKSKRLAGASGSEYEEDPASSSESDSGGEVGNLNIREESDSEDAAKPQKAKRTHKTAAERKREKQKQVRGRIDDAREALPKKLGDKPAKARPSQAASAVVPSDKGQDAFRPTYRALLVQRVSQDGPRTTPARSNARSPVTPPPPSSQFRLRLRGTTPSPDPETPRQRDFTPIQDDEGIRGLDDGDVMINRETVVARPRGRQTQTLQVVYTEPELLKKPKVKRTAQADMDPKRSLSGKQVPPWISDDFEKLIVPTLLEHYGAEEDPWSLDVKTRRPTKGRAVAASSSTGDSDEDLGIVDILQQLINQLFPRKKYELTSKDIIVRVARQRVANWRRAFLDRAISAVATGYQEFKIKNPEVSKDNVADWAGGAMDVKAGFAMWAVPPTDEDPKPRGALRTLYVFKTFGPHFNAIGGSLLADSRPPVGALGLALAALDVAFECYESGEYAPPQEHFDIDLGGVATEDYLRLAVRPLLKTRDRWDEVMELAKEHAPRRQGGRKSRGGGRRRRKHSEVMAGSSPVRPDFV